jgi:hypothetical protein
MTQRSVVKMTTTLCGGWPSADCLLPAACPRNHLACFPADDEEEFGEDDYEFGDEDEDEVDAGAEGELSVAVAPAVS